MSVPESSWAEIEASAGQLEALLEEPDAALQSPEVVRAISDAAGQLRELVVGHQVAVLLEQHAGQWPFEDLQAATGADPGVLRRVLDSMVADGVVLPPAD